MGKSGRKVRVKEKQARVVVGGTGWRSKQGKREGLRDWQLGWESEKEGAQECLGEFLKGTKQGSVQLGGKKVGKFLWVGPRNPVAAAARVVLLCGLCASPHVPACQVPELLRDPLVILKKKPRALLFIDTVVGTCPTITPST